MAPRSPDNAPTDVLNIGDVARAVLDETLALARHSSDALGERTDAVTNMSLAAERLVISAPELGLDACRAVLGLQDGLDSVTDALGRIRALADQARDLNADLEDTEELLTLGSVVARIDTLAGHAVEYGATMAAVYREFDAELVKVWGVIEPLFVLMNAVDDVGADLTF